MALRPAADPSTALGERIAALAALDGPTGGEGPVAAALAEALAPYADRVEHDVLGSVFAVRGARPTPGPGRGAPPPTLIVSARLDEAGLIVARVDPGGFLRFRPLGPAAAMDARAWLGQPVTVHGRRALRGVIGMRPPHVLDAASRDVTPDLDALFVDVGLAEDDVRAAAAIGDAVTMRRSPIRLAGGRWSGKAVAGRAALAAIVEVARRLAGADHACDVVFAGVAQGGFGHRGGVAFGGRLAGQQADELDDWTPRRCAIVLGTTAAGQRGVETSIAVGGGPALGRGPNVHPRLHERLVAAARRLELPHQIEAIAGLAPSEASVLQVTAGGTPCAAIGLPARYGGTAAELIAEIDAARAAQLVTAFAADLDANALSELLPALPAGRPAASAPDAAGAAGVR